MYQTIIIHKAKCGYLWDVAVNKKMKDGNASHNKTPYGDNGRGNTPFNIIHSLTICKFFDLGPVVFGIVISISS